MLAVLHVGRIGFGRSGNAHLRIDRLSNVNRSAPMPNLENLRKQAKLILRWHRDRYYPVAAQIRSGLPRYSRMTDPEILAQSFKLSDAQELVARQHGFESWQALKTGLPAMSEHAETIFTKAVIAGGEPQLFVADIKSSCDFFTGKLGFAIVFTYGEPAFYAQVRRDAALINLRCVEQPVIDAGVRDREQLLLHGVYVRRHLPQTIPAQAIPALHRHRQPRGFLGAPARSRRAAGEFRSAGGTGEAAGHRIF